jgi:hypothetical protein
MAMTLASTPSLVVLVALFGCGSGAALAPPATDGPIDGTDAESIEEPNDTAAVPGCADSAEPWVVSVPLDHADCNARALTSCPESAPDPLASHLLAFASAQCHLWSYAYANVQFAADCPVTLRLRFMHYSADELKPLADCLAAALKQQRWNCGGDRCVTVEHDTLP